MYPSMLNLFLTSNAYMTLELLVPYLAQKPSQMRVAFIPTAANVDPNPGYRRADFDALEELGFSVTEIEISGRSYGDLSAECTGFDVIFVSGGNTFYLLQEMRKSGFDRVVQDHIGAGKWYIGSSAGSVVTGPDIEVIDLLDDPADAPELRSTEALQLIDMLILPHWGRDKYKQRYVQLMSNVYLQGMSIFPLQDTQALLVQGNCYQLLELEDKSKIAIQTYEKIAKSYSDQYFHDLSDASHIDLFLEKLPAAASVIDIGCGPGQFSQYMQQKDYAVLGIDASREMLEIARRKAPGAEFKHMDMRRLDIADESADGLLVAYSLIHIPTIELRSTLKGFLRILRAGGYMLLITQKGEADQVVGTPLGKDHQMFFNFFTQERLREELEMCDFEIISQEEKPSHDPESISEHVIYTLVRKPLD